jgi:NAD(P)-dependent dehydrogenase (short-subunit alcohol dehydrogenase family)
MVGARASGKCVIVTGATGGIGRAVAARFAAQGARLMLADVREAEPALPAALVAAGADMAAFAVCDIGEEAQVDALVERTVAELGGLDAIVNVAGTMIYKPLADLTGEDWRRLLAVNLLGAAFLSAHALRRMREGGAIVNIASVHARQTAPLVAPYAAAKAALCSLTRSTSIEGRERGIRANVILPGAIDTPMLWSSPNIASGAEIVAPGDVGTPDDVAAAAAFLASDDARFVNGAELLVDGGRLSRL